MDAEKILKITGHRFEGYTLGMLAIEVELFKQGPGSGTIAEAVDALKSVATALGAVDEALREGLRKIGASWQSAAGEQVAAVFTKDVDFAADATKKLNDSAQAAFVISEAFTSMVNKLPDPETLRAGEEGLNLGDVLAGLIGHETDHAARVRSAKAARDQTVDAIKEFQLTAANELEGIRPLDEPQQLHLDDGTGPRPPVGSVGGTATTTLASVSVPPGAETQIPASAGPAGAPGAAGWANGGRGTVGPGTVPDGAPAPPPPVTDRRSSHDSGTSPHASAPATDVPAGTSPSQAGATAPSSGHGSTVIGAVGAVPVPGGQSTGSRPAQTVPPGGHGVPGASGGSGGTGGSGGSGGSGASTGGAGRGGTSTGPGANVGEQPGGKGSGPAPRGDARQPGGGSAGGIAAGTGGRPGGSAASGGRFVPGPEGFAGRGPGGSQHGSSQPPEGPGGRGPGAAPPPDKLAGGRTSGVTPLGGQAAPGGATTYVGGTPSGVSPAAAGAAASGAAALAAGGAVGAAGTEEDKQRRAQQLGKHTVVDGRQLYDFDAGETPGEDEARAVEKVEPEQAADQPRYLEQAAMPPRVTEQTRVRTHGVDDVDLFADQRLVAPEVIGDERGETR